MICFLSSVPLMGIPYGLLVWIIAAAATPNAQNLSHPTISGYQPTLMQGDIDNAKVPVFLSGGGYQFGTEENVRLLVFGEEWRTSSNRSTCMRIVEDSRTCVERSGRFFADVRLTRPSIFNGRNCSYEPELCPEGVMEASLPISIMGIQREVNFYLCTFESGSDGCGGVHGDEMLHQGDFPWLTISVKPSAVDLPLPARIVFIIILLCFSGLFSGLNLGLMALDLTTLKIIMESGSKRQKWCAAKIYPVRRHGNYLLCTILLSNVAVNNTIAILMGDLTTGALAIVLATVGIVIFGEIIPQAICSRFGLYIGAGTIWITYIAMVITFPIALPLSFILNRILGQEIGATYNRQELMHLLKITEGKTDIEKGEVNIISGALTLREKKVEEVMTKIENVYMLNIDCTLDFEMIQQIYDRGHSRIPIWEDDPNHIVGILYTKSLALIDPEDKMTLRQYHSINNRPPLFEWVDTRLDQMLNTFVDLRTHLAVVQCVNDADPEKDHEYQVVGIITLEDILEEILQREIVDETDQYVNNEMREKVKSTNVTVGDIVAITSTNSILTSSQRLAVFQVLSTSIPPFMEEHISAPILKRLIQMEGVAQMVQGTDATPITLYQAGEPASCFTLIVEGEAEVIVGKENMKFDCRSFSHFGAQCLLSTSGDSPLYIPDFSVKVKTTCVVLCISIKEYNLAKRMTLGSRQEQSHDHASSNGNLPPPPCNPNDVTPRKEEQVDLDSFSAAWQKMEEEEKVHNKETHRLGKLFRKIKNKSKQGDKERLLPAEEEEDAFELQGYAPLDQDDTTK